MPSWVDWVALASPFLYPYLAAAVISVWLLARLAAFFILRRLVLALLTTAFSFLYLLLPFDFLLDPVFLDDFALLLLAGWQWRGVWKHGVFQFVTKPLLPVSK